MFRPDKKTVNPNFKISLGKLKIEKSECVKYFGVTLDENMKSFHGKSILIL